MLFDTEQIIVRDLDGNTIPVDLSKALGNFIYCNSRTLEWLEISKQITAEKQAKTASNKFGKMTVEYTFDHIKGESPEVIRGRGTIEGSETVLDVLYFPKNRNFQTTFHYLSDDVDVAVIASILKDLKACM